MKRDLRRHMRRHLKWQLVGQLTRQPPVRIATNLLRISALTLVVVSAGASLPSPEAKAQVFDFGQIDSFESAGTGTQRGGAAPKTIVDDGDRHTVVLTILDSNTDAKITWKTTDGTQQTTFVHGTTVQAFQTSGLFKIEALGGDNRSVKYGYVLLRLKESKDRI